MNRFTVALSLTAIGIAALAGSGSATPTATLPGLRSPSGNIRCLLVPGVNAPSRLLCTIVRATYAAKLQARCMGPTGAGVDWHGFELDPRGRGNPTCSGGILYNPTTQHPSFTVVPYGASWRAGAFTCQSRTTGVTCRNRHGHGLFLSRSSWSVW